MDDNSGLPTSLIAVLAISAIGSIVDIIQMVWLARLGWLKFRGGIETKVRSEIEEEKRSRRRK